MEVSEISSQFTAAHTSIFIVTSTCVFIQYVRSFRFLFDCLPSDLSFPWQQITMVTAQKQISVIIIGSVDENVSEVVQRTQ